MGIDEVGRGAWAGPLVVGAVVLGGHAIDGLTDSKKLTKVRRLELDKIIRNNASGVGLGWVSARQIDKIGLSRALMTAAHQALRQISCPYSEIIIDGTVPLLKGDNVTLMKKADLLIPSVSAASIVAKVARDSYMAQLDTVFSGYKFSSHVGYGTAKHRKAISHLGVTPVHRLSFAPLRPYADKAAPESSGESDDRSGVSSPVGAIAEQLVGDYLTSSGHTVLHKNWRTKYCEIDIISRFRNTVFFTEVKYRRQSSHGDGLDAITTKKLKQMEFSARVFQAASNLKGVNMRLAVASVSGIPPQIEHYLEI